MLVEYSKRQRKEILETRFEDTSQIRLTILPQGEPAALLPSLDKQLHRNFGVAECRQAALEQSSDGVLLVSGAAELLSISLMRFAAELRSGAEFVTCDSAFGSCLAAELWWPAGGPGPQQCRCALMARALFEKAAAAVPDGPTAELIAAAMRLAGRRKHLSACLISLRRELQPADIFDAHLPRTLVFSHEFGLSGAPIVLANALPDFGEMGYQSAVVGPSYGGALPLFLQQNVPVLTDAEELRDPAVHAAAQSVELVVANTIVERSVVEILGGENVPVLWWLHDVFVEYVNINTVLPGTKPGNVQIFAVGHRAAAALHSIRPDYPVGQLLYAVPDYAAAGAGTLPEAQLPVLAALEDGRPLFVNIGSLEWRKGQDIFAQAIRLLTAQERNAARFLFVGGSNGGAFVEGIRLLAAEFPQSVFYAGPVSHEAALALLRRCTCAVCSSRDDPMPTFVTEAAVFSRPSIVSEHTGTAGLIEPGVNGLVYKDDDPAALAALLRAVIADPAQMDAMGREARVLYERTFSPAVFHKTFRRAMDDTVRAAAESPCAHEKIVLQ